MIKEHPILFSTPMVRAILEGRKSQTRRIIKPQPFGTIMPHQLKDDGFFREEHIGKWLWETKEGEYLKHCPYGQSGDILWVRETWRPKGHNFPIGYPFEYRATAEEDGVPIDEPWKPSIFMPKEVCRIRLEITNIRVEKLQDISEEDAIAEGISLPNYADQAIKDVHYPEPSTIYSLLWENINGDGSWALNPWVWVIKFNIKDK
jgi:hypothetical protein